MAQEKRLEELRVELLVTVDEALSKHMVLNHGSDRISERCTASNPHSNLRYQQGIYSCDCGAHYVSAEGVLVEIERENV